jgi:hypothetical protein
VHQARFQEAEPKTGENSTQNDDAEIQAFAETQVG